MRKQSFSKVVMVQGHFQQSVRRAWELRHGPVLVGVRHLMSKKVAKGESGVSVAWGWGPLQEGSDPGSGSQPS